MRNLSCLALINLWFIEVRGRCIALSSTTHAQHALRAAMAMRSSHSARGARPFSPCYPKQRTTRATQRARRGEGDALWANIPESPAIYAGVAYTELNLALRNAERA